MGGSICCDPSGKHELGQEAVSNQAGTAYLSAGHLATDEGMTSGVPHAKGVAAKYSGADPGTAALTDLRQLVGKWNREADGLVMGKIVGDEVLWNPDYQHQPSKLSLVTGKVGVPKAADVEMELGNEKHWARYEVGPPPQLAWSDGEVWVLQES